MESDMYMLGYQIALIANIDNEEIEIKNGIVYDRKSDTFKLDRSRFLDALKAKHDADRAMKVPTRRVS